jgi:hypothetical protein
MPEGVLTIQFAGNILDDSAEAVGVKNNSQQDEWQAPRPIHAPRRCISGNHRPSVCALLAQQERTDYGF